MSSGPRAGASLARVWADEAHALVQAEPRKALELAERALAAASADGDVAAAVAARYALAWAQHSLGQAQEGRRTLRAGIRLAERHGDRHGVGLLRRHLAYQLSTDGDLRSARREIEAAIAVLTGVERARSHVHLVAIHRRSQSADPELHRRIRANAARALRVLDRAGDAIWQARLLYNLGGLCFERGELDEAEARFRGALALYRHVGADAAAADSILALAEVALLRGDVVACLETLEEVAPVLPPDYVYSNLDECRLMALQQARLLPEARAAAEAYIALCQRTGRGDFAAAATLDLAAIAVLAGDASAGRALATRAARWYAARNKPVHAALARVAVLRAQLAEGRVRQGTVRVGLAAAATLEGAGWRRDALRTRLVVANLALERGSPSFAREQLELARALHRHGTISDRVELCRVEARLLAAEGQASRAERRLLRGLRLLDDYRAAFGGFELRATATGIGRELGSGGLSLALASKRPAKILAWSERLRANALRLPPVRPPADRRLRDLQVALRRATATGRASEQARLEHAIRTRTRALRGDGNVAPLGDLRQSRQALGHRALVEYTEVGGGLYAVTLAGGGLAFHTIGAGTAELELEWLRFAFRRLAAGRLTAGQRAAAGTNAAASAAALEATLLEPLLPALGEAPLVIVPTGALHALPWAALPSLRGRPVVVAPSVTSWSMLATRPRSRRRRRALVAGPHLRHAAAEVRELGALRPGSTVLTGKAATAEATLAALDGAALAHLACHGHFRADSPLFSSLELADGPLNVYELQNLRRAPETVVLSACDLALSQLHPGDELLGLAAALLGMGTRTVVASVVPVPDAESRRVMLAFHRELARGTRPAEALARAQIRARVPGFVCLGHG